MGKILELNGKPMLDIYDEDRCNMLKGTDGTLYPPFISKDQTFELFILDICRSFKFVFQKEEFYNGIEGYRYVLPDNFWKSTDPENHCYCVEKDKTNFPPSGVLSVAQCKKGSFYKAFLKRRIFCYMYCGFPNTKPRVVLCKINLPRVLSVNQVYSHVVLRMRFLFENSRCIGKRRYTDTLYL